MRVLVYDSHDFELRTLSEALAQFELSFVKHRLDKSTVALSQGFDAVLVFIHDQVNAEVIALLATYKVKFIVTRSAGYNHIDLLAAHKNNILVANVPEYSPYAVAEHAVMLILALNRKVIRSHHRLLDLNFSLNGLVGFDLHGKKVGVIGLGKIGQAFARIMHGFGSHILAYDPVEVAEMKALEQLEYVSLEQLFRDSDIISLHVPLNDQTQYMINEQSIRQMKDGVMLINTSRGALIKTKDVIQAIKAAKIAYLGIDVYEEENELFFEDHSEEILQDDVIARLMTFPNVIITSHQAFLTREALENIARTTQENLLAFASGKKCDHLIQSSK